MVYTAWPMPDVYKRQGTLRALRAGFKAAVLHTVIIGALRVPFELIAQILYLNVVFFDVRGSAGQIDGKVRRVHLEILLQLPERHAAQIDICLLYTSRCV